MTTNLRFLVLGAAAGGGLPQWNCGCQNCVLARDVNSHLPPQTQSSLAVSLDGEQWAILNASPDIGQQLQSNAQLHPRSLRGTPIVSVAITNGDIDHLAGLLVLREKQAYKLFVTGTIANILDNNPVFRVIDDEFVVRTTTELEIPFALLPGLEATFFPVPGKAPLFMEEIDPEIGIEGEQTIGVELSANGVRAFYIPGCAAIPSALAERLGGADLLFFDGTLFTDDEMIALNTGTKTGRRMGHMQIDGDGGSLEVLRILDIGRKIYIHINNTNPIWRSGPEREKVERHGFEVGFDGMEVALAASSRQSRL